MRDFEGKHEFKLRPVSKTEALELYKDNVYKTEMITNLEDGYNYVLPMILTDYIVVVMFEYWNNQSMKILSVVRATLASDEKTNS
jgi:hypothetical protein